MKIKNARIRLLANGLFEENRACFRDYEEDEIFQDLNSAMARSISFRLLRKK